MVPGNLILYAILHYIFTKYHITNYKTAYAYYIYCNCTPWAHSLFHLFSRQLHTFSSIWKLHTSFTPLILMTLNLSPLKSKSKPRVQHTHAPSRLPLVYEFPQAPSCSGSAGMTLPMVFSIHFSSFYWTILKIHICYYFSYIRNNSSSKSLFFASILLTETSLWERFTETTMCTCLYFPSVFLEVPITSASRCHSMKHTSIFVTSDIHILPSNGEVLYSLALPTFKATFKIWSLPSQNSFFSWIVDYQGFLSVACIYQFLSSVPYRSRPLSLDLLTQNCYGA